MSKPASNRKVNVAIPTPEEERPRYGHIGIIAAVCFAVGIAWPFAAGVRLVPSAPQDDEPKTPKVAATEPAAPSPSASVPPAPVEEIARAEEQTIEIEKSLVANCRSADGKKPSSCDTPNLGESFDAHFKGLVSCEAANGAQGTLSLGLKLDFKTNEIVDVVRGRSSSLSKERAEGLLACAKKELVGTSLANVKHQHENYMLFYFLKLLPKGSPLGIGTQATAGALVPASGSATVLFDSALVREQADPNSTVLVRLLYGTRVVVTGRLGVWYEIKYDGKGAKGFIHKNAIGMQ